jgi:hypothetical protein
MPHNEVSGRTRSRCRAPTVADLFSAEEKLRLVAAARTVRPFGKFAAAAAAADPG